MEYQLYAYGNQDTDIPDNTTQFENFIEGKHKYADNNDQSVVGEVVNKVNLEENNLAHNENMDNENN